jgi:NAD+ kinase
MEKIAITTRSKLKYPQKLLAVLECLRGCNKKVYLDDHAQFNLPKTSLNWQHFDWSEEIDLLIVMGGDGTVLRACRSLQDFRVPILGINAGNLGFLSEIKADNFTKVCDFFWQGNYSLDQRMLLKIEVLKAGKVIQKFRALNELAIKHSLISRIIELPMKIDTIDVATYRADGLIIATPTGSTAHSLSAGGPIVHPKMAALIVTPISPHSFSQRPIIIPPEKTITINPISTREKIALTIDGQVCEIIEDDSEIRITRSKQTIQFLRLYNENFFTTLRGKLGWGAGFSGGANGEEN